MSYPPPDGTEPPSYQPGSASIPPPQQPYYPPTSQFPPAADHQQPPPGYQPGPPPGFQPGPPPGFQPGPPPPPPRRSNLPIVAVIVAVALLLCGGVATAGVLIARQATEKAKEAVEPITRPTLPALPSNPVNIPDLPTDLPDLPTDIPGLPDPNKQIKVTYEVRGDGPVDIIYVEKLSDGPKTIRDAKLPWKFTTTMTGAALVSVTAVRGTGEQGKISCRATVDGDEVAQSSKTGAFASASCIKAIIG